ncbi:targeting protein for Xklp2 [Salarias fasciatus]|uniref:TPX2 microtubule nucleation factor n=1 Tax=Salarias fasciatus TaxID=181472 RepID=A0A672JL71_SALFA|nr:targeting protein for Xklp2 [Salarias fasciatus]XP_029975680.1 targeting protein for Xklp2 [Salarias fasciatus]
MAESEKELYEFDVPSHENFQELLNSDVDDQWFEKKTRFAVTPLKRAEPSADGKPEAAGAGPQAQGPPAGAGPQAQGPPAGAGPQAQGPPAGAGPQATGVSVGADTRPKAAVAPCFHKAQDSNPETSARPPNLVTSWGAERCTGAQPKRSNSNPGPAQPRRVSKRLTVGVSSAPPSKKRKEQGTSEERELERIKNLQKEVAQHRKKNEASFKAALAGMPPPKKMVPSATVPKDFHFSTDSRVKASAASSTSLKELDFSSQLRKPSSPIKTRRGATIPKPFKLSGGAKQKKPEEASAFVSMAQRIQQYETKTPPRYHLPSRHTQERGPSQGKGDHLKITQPHSPHLMTLRRARPTSVKSSAEQEAEEAEQVKNFKVKALELNRKILEGAEPLKRPATREPTVPESFELEIERRLQERQSARRTAEGPPPYNFRARPLPRDVLEGVQGVPEKKTVLPTVPESPAFVLKKRVRVEPPVEVKRPSPVKTRSMLHSCVPFQPRLPENPQVQVCPFSFEQRERERQALKEKRLKEQQKEEVAQFKALPLPDFNTVQLPEKKKVEPTKPEPFRLLLDERGAVKASRWEQMVKEEQQHQQEAATFKARPNTVVHKEPFRPRKEERPAVAVEAFELATERRARDWEELEQQADLKEVLKAQQEAARRLEEEQKEREEIARLRQEQVHKAQPIRHYRPVSVKKSEIPLTIPESPNFSDRFRL